MFNDYQTRAVRMKGLRHRHSLTVRFIKVLLSDIRLQYQDVYTRHLSSLLRHTCHFLQKLFRLPLFFPKIVGNLLRKCVSTFSHCIHDTPHFISSLLLTGAVHLQDILFRKAHNIPLKVLRSSKYSLLTSNGTHVYTS